MINFKFFSALLMSIFLFCTVDQPFEIPHEDMQLQNQIDQAKRDAEQSYKEKGYMNEEFPIYFVLDYRGRIIIDPGKLRSNPRTMIEHLQNQYWKGGIIEGDIIGIDTLTQYSHWVQYAADSIPNYYWRHANCQFEISYGGTILLMHVFWSYKEPPNYAYGFNFGGIYKDEKNKTLWIIEAMIEADRWDDLIFQGEGKIKKFQIN